MRAQRVWSTPSGDAHDALRWLTAAQAQEFSYAKWSLAQRTKRETDASVQRAFDDGRILRTHVLRPTWHFVSPEDLRWLMRLSGPRVNARNARRYAELGLDAKTLARSNDVIAQAVSDRYLTRRDLAAVLNSKRLPTDGQRIAFMLMRAELDAVICSGPMAGKRHTYALFDDRAPPARAIDRDEALAELARRYFTARGPATLKDFAWWSGLSAADARRGLDLASTSLQRRDADGRTYWFAERSAPRAMPRVDLVQCYDETIISYTESRDVLQSPSASFAVPRNVDGFTHVVLLGGHLLGHWRRARTRTGIEIETRISKRLTSTQNAALAAAIDRYRRFALDDKAGKPARAVRHITRH